MLTADGLFELAMTQRYGVTDLVITTRARFVFSYADLDGKVKHVMQPVLTFSYGNARVEKAIPMLVRDEWPTGSAGVAMRTIVPESAWTADDIERYIADKVADLKDNALVKGSA